MSSLFLLLAGACAETGGGDSAAGNADGGAVSADGGAQVEWNGTVPPVPVDLPDFAATNRDGTGRSREDVLGHPTVMWFYPTAGTSG